MRRCGQQKAKWWHCARTRLKIERVLWSEKIYLVPRNDGRILAGATVEYAGFDKALTAGGVEKILAAAIELSPGLAARARGRNLGGTSPRLAGPSAHPRTNRHRWIADRNWTFSQRNSPDAHYRAAGARVGDATTGQRGLGTLQPHAVSVRLHPRRARLRISRKKGLGEPRRSCFCRPRTIAGPRLAFRGVTAAEPEAA